MLKSNIIHNYNIIWCTNTLALFIAHWNHLNDEFMSTCTELVVRNNDSVKEGVDYVRLGYTAEKCRFWAVFCCSRSKVKLLTHRDVSRGSQKEVSDHGEERCKQAVPGRDGSQEAVSQTWGTELEKQLENIQVDSLVKSLSPHLLS